MKKIHYCFRAGKPRPYKLSIAIFILLVGLVVGARSSRPVYAFETTLYFGPTEKTYDNLGKLTQTKTYISVGSATVVKTQTGSTPPNTEYLYSDHLGSTVLTTSEAGVKLDSILYYPYGNSVGAIHELPLRTDRLYTGQRKDFSSDLYFYNARYYNPITGNFVSSDKAQGPNRYSYVENNPVMRNDPTENCFLGIIGSDCNLPSYARYATKEEQNQPENTVNNYGFQASLLGGAAFLADQNIPVVSGIAGSYAKVADEIIIGSITNNSSLYTLGGMDLMTAVAEAYTAVLTGKALAQSGSSVLRYGAWQLQQKVGNQELNPAIKAQMVGDYDAVGNITEATWKKTDPNFNGFQSVKFNDSKMGGLGDQISESLNPAQQSSLKIHETSHQLDSYNGTMSQSSAGKGVTLTSKYGLYVQDVFRTEGKAYLAEYAGGGKSLYGAFKNFTYSSGRTTGGFFSATKDLLFNR